MNKQELNMKAARMCGNTDITDTSTPFAGMDIYDDDSVYLNVNSHNKVVKFNLDTSAADREATVIALGEKYEASIFYDDLRKSWACDLFDTYWYILNATFAYKEALYAAVEAAPEQEGV
jgi:hypothetical protein